MKIHYSDILNTLGFKKTLQAGYYVETINSDENQPKRVYVLWYWLATIPDSIGEDIKLGVVATDSWLKGMLLVPSISEEKLAGLQPYRSVLLNDWKDEVVEVLQTYNVMPIHIRPDFGKETDFDLSFGTIAGFGRFRYSTRIKADIHVTSLWNALQRTMIRLADVYNEAEIKEAIGYERLKIFLSESKGSE